MTTDRYDVIAVSLADHSVRLLDTDKTAANAEAIVEMAVIRRGVEEEFFTTAPAGRYETGDLWGTAR